MVEIHTMNFKYDILYKERSFLSWKETSYTPDCLLVTLCQPIIRKSGTTNHPEIWKVSRTDRKVLLILVYHYPDDK